MKRESEAALAGMMKPMKREDVTDLIVFRKMKMGIKWPQIAKAVGQSKEWTAAACLGQMQMSGKQAQAVGKLFDLPEEAVLLLQQVPYKGSLRTAVPTRLHLQGADPRRVRRRHHERDRLRPGPHAAPAREGRPGQDRDERQVPAVQDVLDTPSQSGRPGGARLRDLAQHLAVRSPRALEDVEAVIRAFKPVHRPRDSQTRADAFH